MQTQSHVDKCCHSVLPHLVPPGQLSFSSEYCPTDVQQACTTTEEAKSDMDLFPHISIGM